MAERQGVEINYCPQCHGAWLDRGELDKIIERSTSINRDDEDDYQQQPSGKRKRDELFDEEGQRTYDGDDTRTTTALSPPVGSSLVAFSMVSLTFSTEDRA